MEAIRPEDLQRLAEMAFEDQATFFRHYPDIAAIYRDRLLCVALCQGAALHYVDRTNGIKDFDVWSFYLEAATRPFPRRRPGVSRDFGDPRFGRSPDAPEFRGRRVDIFVKSFEASDGMPFDAAVRQYLRSGRTPSARFLAQKAVIVLYPTEWRGRVLWPVQGGA